MHKPSIVLLNETKQPRGINFNLPGYVLVDRRDRRDHGEPFENGGGIAVFVSQNLEGTISLAHKSEHAERMWFCVHTDTARLLLCCWYRRPQQGEVDSIITLEKEYVSMAHDYNHVAIIGDCNVHEVNWLTHSSCGSSPEGRKLWLFARTHSLSQVVKGPTRYENLLDLVLTTARNCQCEIANPITDHFCLHVHFDFTLRYAPPILREVYRWDLADWDSIHGRLEHTNWFYLTERDVDSAASWFQCKLEDCLVEEVPKHKRKFYKTGHPWLKHRNVQLIRRKHASYGTKAFSHHAAKSDDALWSSYLNFAQRTKTTLRRLKRGSKAWWSLAKRATDQSTVKAVFGPIRRNNVWAADSTNKCNMFADCFAEKYTLPERVENVFSAIPDNHTIFYMPRVAPLDSLILQILLGLGANSATGPDNIPARFLKECGNQLVLPFRILCQRVLDEGVWPECWRWHRIHPLYKRGAATDPCNYRGIHITSHISKVVERMLKHMLAPVLQRPVVTGPNQFAYLTQRGARDALAYLVLILLDGFARNRKFGFFKGDVRHAFDCVGTPRFMGKLQALGVPQNVLKFARSWLSARQAYVELHGISSESIALSNQVFQGTVLGPLFWNAFFSDSERALAACLFEGIYYADDLNAVREFDGQTNNNLILQECASCQASLHAWGAANQVVFDPNKESSHVISLTHGDGSCFTLLGVLFDSNLSMGRMCEQLVSACKWKVACIHRCKAFHTISDQLQIFKSKIWSYLEYRTSAIYHCTAAFLDEIDGIQTCFLRRLNLSVTDAALHYNFLPLCTRRDIAMLGILHRARLGRGPPHFKKFFTVVPGSTLLTCSLLLALLRRARHLFVSVPVQPAAIYGWPLEQASTLYFIFCLGSHSSI